MIIYGKQIVLMAMRDYVAHIVEFYLSKQLPHDIFRLIKATQKPITIIDNKKAQALAKGGNHQGIFARMTPLESTPFHALLRKSTILVLCGISDMGNIGAIFRSAYALGVEAILITSIQSLKIAHIVRASSGAAFAMPFCVRESVLDCIHELRMGGFALYGADMAGTHIAHFCPHDKWALFLGAESHGLRKKITQKLDKMLAIPMHNRADSLNVSVAAGILMAYLDSNATYHNKDKHE